MSINKQRIKINALYDQLLVEHRIPVSISEGTGNEVNDRDLLQCGIHRISYDFNILNDTSANLEQLPSFLFWPLSPEFFRNHPIDPSPLGSEEEQKRALAYREYKGPTDRAERFAGAWNPHWCSLAISRYVESWATGLPRHGLGPWWGLKTGPRWIEPICLPHPFLLHESGLTGAYPTGRDAWYGQCIFGCVDHAGQPLPHIICSVTQNSDGKDNSILFGELASIVTAMQSRANQPKVDTDDEEAQEALFHATEEELRSMPRAFAMERRFPVLLLSFVGPQHGRLFYTCMDGETLFIRQSKIHSFEKKDPAVLDLFAGFFCGFFVEQAFGGVNMNRRFTLGRTVM